MIGYALVHPWGVRAPLSVGLTPLTRRGGREGRGGEGGGRRREGLMREGEGESLIRGDEVGRGDGEKEISG